MDIIIIIIIIIHHDGVSGMDNNHRGSSTAEGKKNTINKI